MNSKALFKIVRSIALLITIVGSYMISACIVMAISVSLFGQPNVTIWSVAACVTLGWMIFKYITRQGK